MAAATPADGRLPAGRATRPRTPSRSSRRDVREVIEDIKELRRGKVLGKGLAIRQLIDEGRRD